MQLEHTAVRGRRAVERDLLLHAALGVGELLVVGAGDDEQRPRDLERRAVAARRLESSLDRGHRHLLDVPLGREAVDDDPVGDLSRDLAHLLADRGQEDLGYSEGIGRRREERRHQRVAVELALELERRLLVPRAPDGAQREDVLAHAAGRMRPRHREPLLDVGLDLRTQTEDEAPAATSPADRWRCTPAPSGCAANATAMPVASSMRSVCSAASAIGRNASWPVSAVSSPS